MALTINAKSYNLDTTRTPDWVRYSGPSQDLSTSDYVDCKRSFPKPSSTDAGRGKSSIKLTRTLTDGTDDVGNGILEVSVSFPADSQVSEQATMITDIATWLATASADDLFSSLDINQ